MWSGLAHLAVVKPSLRATCPGRRPARPRLSPEAQACCSWAAVSSWEQQRGPLGWGLLRLREGCGLPQAFPSGHLGQSLLDARGEAAGDPGTFPGSRGGMLRSLGMKLGIGVYLLPPPPAL